MRISHPEVPRERWCHQHNGTRLDTQAGGFGIDPAIHLEVDPSTALVDLGSAVSTVPQDSECLSVDEVPQT